MSGEPARTVVFFHAHPDDEAIFTGGTMALLAAAGWRVVLVLATAGEQGLTSALDGPVAEAADRLAGILVEERARALVGYDGRGIYGHVDHIHVHHVGVAAAQE